MRKSSKSSFTTQYIILFGAVFLLANIVLGIVLHEQSTQMVQTLIRKSMLNVSNTAADLIDGDAIGALTKEDVGSEPYNIIYDDLTVFQNNTDIEFIYAVRQVGPDEFVFTVDPDPVDPGEFGEEVLVTDALRKAGEGVAAIDSAPAADRWGNFYSAYSPVFDSKGNVAGIIGVDFSSSWYDDQIWKNTFFVIIISVLFTLVGLAGLFLLGMRMHRRFEDLNNELSLLSDDVEELTQEILASSGFDGGSDEIAKGMSAEDESDGSRDEIQTLGSQIHSMHREVKQYLDYMHERVNTDALTGVGNTTAYSERIKEIDSDIQDNKAEFSVVMFDINDLKLINDRYGHIGGDKAIRAAARVIAEVYGKENTFRIGGDEFIAIIGKLSDDEAAGRAQRIKELTDEYNRTRLDSDAALSLSLGQAAFIPGQDHSFRDVFVRADEQMYKKKDSYHHRDGSTDNN
ncbi:MAG: diguanylate cyclase [Eubacterium sp.]|nr:diguanylate cyclase [Eubacterium sp.]